MKKLKLLVEVDVTVEDNKTITDVQGAIRKGIVWGLDVRNVTSPLFIDVQSITLKGMEKWPNPEKWPEFSTKSDKQYTMMIQNASKQGDQRIYSASTKEEQHDFYIFWNGPSGIVVLPDNKVTELKQRFDNAEDAIGNYLQRILNKKYDGND